MFSHQKQVNEYFKLYQISCNLTPVSSSFTCFDFSSSHFNLPNGGKIYTQMVVSAMGMLYESCFRKIGRIQEKLADVQLQCYANLYGCFQMEIVSLRVKKLI